MSRAQPALLALTDTTDASDVTPEAPGRGHWLALLPGTSTGEQAGPRAADARALGLWLLQFSPRVALHEEAVLMEAEASLRLFGGARALHRQVRAGAQALGAGPLAWASTGLGALALARSRLPGAGPTGRGGTAAPPHTTARRVTLDALPLHSLSAVARHQPTLARMGCQTLGDVRRLPRAGLGRRFDAALLTALDQAYGQAAESYPWLSLPAGFSARLELWSRVEDASALLTAAQRLLLQLQGWLRARQSGVRQLTLRWLHDSFRARDCAAEGELTLGTAEPTQDIGHLSRLLAEHLARVTLAAPVSDLELRVMEVALMQPGSRSLLPGADRANRADCANPANGTGAEPLARTLERIAARLGAAQLSQPRLQPDHRPERMLNWHPWQPRSGPAAALAAGMPGRLPLPAWQLAQPQHLQCAGERPLFHGPLQLLLGPDRIEGGWWSHADAAGGGMVARDYWLAYSPAAGLLSVFRTGLQSGQADWFLQGRFG